MSLGLNIAVNITLLAADFAIYNARQFVENFIFVSICNSLCQIMIKCYSSKFSDWTYPEVGHHCGVDIVDKSPQ